MSITRVILLGNLGKDPEVRYTSSQMAVSSFSIATNERKKDSATGQWTDHTEWHNIVTFGKTAENCAQYLKKGRQVLVEGSIRSRKWQDKEGKDRYITEIVAQNIVFVGGGKEAGRGGSMSVDNTPSSGGRELVESLPAADSLTGGSLTGGSSESGGSSSFNSDDIPF